jgi:hypothetical protein
MSGKSKKILLLLLAAALLLGISQVQNSMNRDRDQLGLTNIEPLTNAPPVLAFTTVALGGFRGLISNALWMRASELQEEDKFFEMAQLADWITKLEPHFAQVWVFQAWNMAYNISVKFKEFPDRWRWVQRGIELLRDDGLRYNPNDVLIYRELAWFFQHKIGANIDDASMYYKQQWANDMAEVFAKKTPSLDELIHPQTENQAYRAALLRNKYKMDPNFMKEVDERYGPLEWRLPEAHAIYWAALGLEKAKENPTKVKKEDLIMLRRVVYQSMLLSFQRGRLVVNPFEKSFMFGPNLDIIPKVDSAYSQAEEEDEPNRDHIQRAHRNFLCDAVYFLYVHNRIAEAAKWFRTIGTNYPKDMLLTGKTNSLPANLTLDQYAVARVQEDVNETSRDRVTSAIEGLINNSYESLVLDEDERAAGFNRLAKKIWEAYQSAIYNGRESSIGLDPLPEIEKRILNRLLDPDEGMPAEARAVLRTKLGLPAQTAPAPAGAAEPGIASPR